MSEKSIFAEQLKNLTKEEHLEILRIIKKHNVQFTENSNGIFFPMSIIKPVVFDEMNNFLKFCLNNRAELRKRDKELTKYHVDKDTTVILPPPEPRSVTSTREPDDSRETEIEKYKETLHDETVAEPYKTWGVAKSSTE